MLPYRAALQGWLRDEARLPLPHQTVEVLQSAARQFPVFAEADLQAIVAQLPAVSGEAWPYLFQLEVLHTVWKGLLAEVPEVERARYVLKCCPWMLDYQRELIGLLVHPPHEVVGKIVAEESWYRQVVSVSLALVLQGAPTESLLRAAAGSLVAACASERALADQIMRDGFEDDNLLDGMIMSVAYQRAWALWSFLEALGLAADHRRLTPSLRLRSAA